MIQVRELSFNTLLRGTCFSVKALGREWGLFLRWPGGGTRDDKQRFYPARMRAPPSASVYLPPRLGPIF